MNVRSDTVKYDGGMRFPDLRSFVRVTHSLRPEYLVQEVWPVGPRHHRAGVSDNGVSKNRAHSRSRIAAGTSFSKSIASSFS